MSDERADAIPEAAVRAAMKEWQGASYGEVRAIIAAAAPFLRAAHPKAGSEETDRLRKTLHDVGAWLSSGNFAGWEMVVSEIEATLRAAHPEADPAPDIMDEPAYGMADSYRVSPDRAPEDFRPGRVRGTGPGGPRETRGRAS